MTFFKKMKKYGKKSIIVIFTVIILSVFNSNASGMLSYNVTHSPENPIASSQISFTATFDNTSSFEQVNIELQECNGKKDICYYGSKLNLTMIKADNNSYETTASLSHADATYVEYTLLVKTNGTWSSYIDKTKIDLTVKANENDNNDEDQDIPGFEIIGILIASVFLITIYYRRKQNK